MADQNKLKKWLKEHEKDITNLVYYGLGFGVAWYACGKIHDMEIGAGMMRLHEVGILKYFDPTTGSEIDVSEAAKVANKIL